jgi:hypothetical protein
MKTKYIPGSHDEQSPREREDTKGRRKRTVARALFYDGASQ